MKVGKIEYQGVAKPRLDIQFFQTSLSMRCVTPVKKIREIRFFSGISVPQLTRV
jgi:hypothetical protein